MTIRNRLSYLFTGIVAASILAFSVTIYLLSERYRQIEIDALLRQKAISTVEFAVEMYDLNPAILQKFSKNNNYLLQNESALVYLEDDPNHQEIWKSGIMDVPNVDQYFYNIKEKKERHVHLDDDTEMFGILYSFEGKNYVSIAKAYDQYGISKMNNLRRNLLIGWFGSVFIVFLISRYYSRKALQPINNVIKQVENIEFTNLDQRVIAGEEEDEIAHLAGTFNGMLRRLKNAFEAQKSFVSNASHELRTPLTAMNGQIEVALLKKRTEAEYKNTLLSIKEDIAEMTDLSNSLLDLALVESGVAKINFESVRIDEILWQAQSDLKQKRPDATVIIDFGEIPEVEEEFMVQANEQLLKTAVINLMENGCKFSIDKKVEVLVYIPKNQIKITFTNQGSPIPNDEIPHLFVPFFRSESTKKIKGHGIGLALTKKIIELHNGTLSVDSTIEKGTVFTLIINRK
ncbi:MAG: HAMP domain-containing sensor histidine kinase [Bacteroidota bacterium]